MNAIRNQEGGFRYEKPWRKSERTLCIVVPVLREGAPPRYYITLQEAGNKVDITDSGEVNRVNIKNNTGERVFVRNGTIFKGDLPQERAVEGGRWSCRGRSRCLSMCDASTPARA